MIDQVDLNEEHLANPSPGDLWHHGVSPVFVVMAVNDNGIIICDERSNVEDPDYWVPDVTRAKFISFDCFYGKIRDDITGECRLDVIVGEPIFTDETISEWNLLGGSYLV